MFYKLPILAVIFALTLSTGRAASFPVAASEQSAWEIAMNASLGNGQIIAVTGQPFAQATQLTVNKLPDKFWDVQLRSSSIVAVPAETPLTLTFHARSAAAKGRLAVKVEKVGADIFFTKEDYELTPEWQKFELTGVAKTTVFPGQLRVVFMAGQQLQTVEIGGVELQATPAPLSPAATAPVVVPEGMDVYNQWLVKDLKEKFGVTAAPLFAPTEEAMNKQIWMGGPSIAGATRTVIPVENELFKQAVAFNVMKLKGENWHIMGGIWNPVPMVKGRTYLLTYYARGRVPGIGGSNVLADVAVRNTKSSKFWVQTGVVIGENWQRFFVPFTPDMDAPVKTVQFPIVIGMQIQEIEFGGVAVLDCGNTPLEKLPGMNTPTMNYSGRAADAPWRKEANARIEKLRKGDLTIKVVGADGKPVTGAQIKVEMKRHAFGWGTAIVPSYTLHSPLPLLQLERENIPKYFNHIAIDIDLKQFSWLKKTPEQRELVLSSLKKLKEQGYTLNNGVIIWPGFRTNQSWVPLRDKPEELKAAVEAFITDVATATEPYIDEVVVVNEPYSDRAIARTFGEEESFTHWYQMVRKLQPRAKLMLNEAGLTNNHNGLDRPRQDFIYKLAKMLISKGLLDSIGEQSHYTSPIELDRVQAVWDRLGSLGKPIQVTEFDLSFANDEQLEADYTRDLTTLAFAHPSMEAFTMWGFIDELHWKKNAVLYSAKDGKTLTLKPSGKAWLDLVFGDWWTKVDGQTNSDGTFSTRGFLGDYEITVTANGQTQTVPTKLLKSGTTLTVKLP